MEAGVQGRDARPSSALSLWGNEFEFPPPPPQHLFTSLIRPGVSLGLRLGVPPVSPRLSGSASARRVLLPTPHLQRPLKFIG
jgi:hypothetical protein